MIKRYREGVVSGFTTNPTLMAKAGIKDYQGFAKEVLATIKDLPISFEVFSDDFAEMKRQALIIKSWGEHVNVKIPITNTRSESAIPLIEDLFRLGVKLNVTAIFTELQFSALRKVTRPEDDVIVSIFAGRIADTGVDPIPIMKRAVDLFRDRPKAKILWASPREALNIVQAEMAGCHIITVTDDLLTKRSLRNKDLTEYSLETVKMFYNDATKAGFRL
ncbi:MAG: transaldolase [Bdellovibrio sp.]|nr:MAG: transaldolase [Bdellovibrio sp.]